VTAQADEQVRVRVAVIGAGFSGIGVGVYLTRAGINDFLILERSSEIGGVWRDNTYPGAACDTPSQLYSFSFAPSVSWHSSYGRQKEIFAYQQSVIKQFDLADRIRTNHDVSDASWDCERGVWILQCHGLTVIADVLADCAGPLVDPAMPDIPGLGSFKGPLFHSARWDHGIDLRDKAVAVIGTGASSIQFVPEIAASVDRLLVFQRTAPWVFPKRDRTIGSKELRALRRVPALVRGVRAMQRLTNDLTRYRVLKGDTEMSRLARRAALKNLAKEVPDPRLRALLTPNFEVGCKRMLLSNDWYATLVKPHVYVIATAIAEIRSQSIVTADGRERNVDAIICATGFKTLDSRIGQTIHGRDGRSLAQHWADNPMTYRGTEIAGFPNLYRFASAGSGLGHGSMIWMSEAQATHMIAALRFMDVHGVGTVEVSGEAVNAYIAAVNPRLAASVWATGGCHSWYQDASGSPSTMWPGTMIEYSRLLAEFVPSDHVTGAGPVEVQTTRANGGGKDE